MILSSEVTGVRVAPRLTGVARPNSAPKGRRVTGEMGTLWAFGARKVPNSPFLPPSPPGNGDGEMGQNLTVTEMGMIARDLLAQEQEASVMGATSLGLFLRLSPPWVIFISLEAYRGPLTLNLKRDSGGLKRLTPSPPTGSSARIYPDRIVFSSSDLVINTGQSMFWQAPARPEGNLPPAQLKAQLEGVARLVLAGQKPSLLGSLLPVLLGFEAESNTGGDVFSPLLERLGRSLGGNDIPAIAEAIEAFLGLGTGLTPSGDDLILGLLLAVNRWGQVLDPSLEVEALNQTVLPLAYRRTTLLAANLIECASRGQADERLLLALDGIVTGQPDKQTCASCLAGWGNSSGLDALVGMALVLALI